MKRKSISKKLRFEIFKRDSFTCQYCGSTPPKVALEIDHITPVSKGGNNNTENLITSCFNCNRGKSNIELKRIIPTMAESLKSMVAKEEQLKEFKKFTKKIKRRRNREINRVAKIYEEEFEGWLLTSSFKKNSIGRFLKELPIHEVEEAMEQATSIIADEDGAIKYFCGICWNKINPNRR